MFLWTSCHSFGQGQLEEKDSRENVSGALHTDFQLYKINASKGSENIILLCSFLPQLEKNQKKNTGCLFHSQFTQSPLYSWTANMTLQNLYNIFYSFFVIKPDRYVNTKILWLWLSQIEVSEHLLLSFNTFCYHCN